MRPDNVRESSVPRVGLKSRAFIVCITVFCASLITQQGCLLSRHECDPGPPTCTSPTTIRECLRGEGNTYVHERECPAEQRCVVYPARAVCEGASAGGECRSDEGCQSNLRCDDWNRCRGPTVDEIRLCETGPRVVVPDDGSEIVVEVPLTRSPTLANAIARRGCSPPLGHVVAEGFLRLALEGNDAMVDVGFAGPSEGFPEGIQFSEVTCSNLYGHRIPCTMRLNDAPKPVAVRCEQDSALFFYTTQSLQPDSTVHVRVQRRSYLNSVPCHAKGVPDENE